MSPTSQAVAHSIANPPWAALLGLAILLVLAAYVGARVWVDLMDRQDESGAPAAPERPTLTPYVVRRVYDWRAEETA